MILSKTLSTQLLRPMHGFGQNNPLNGIIPQHWSESLDEFSLTVALAANHRFILTIISLTIIFSKVTLL